MMSFRSYSRTSDSIIFFVRYDSRDNTFFTRIKFWPMKFAEKQVCVDQRQVGSLSTVEPYRMIMLLRWEKISPVGRFLRYDHKRYLRAQFLLAP